jgi:hypothetical protein
VFIDTGSPEIAQAIAGHVVAFESGTSDADQQQATWSVCAVGVVAWSAEVPAGETILEMHPELLSGWIDRPADHGDPVERRAKTLSLP